MKIKFNTEITLSEVSGKKCAEQQDVGKLISLDETCIYHNVRYNCIENTLKLNSRGIIIVD